MGNPGKIPYEGYPPSYEGHPPSYEGHYTSYEVGYPSYEGYPFDLKLYFLCDKKVCSTWNFEKILSDPRYIDHYRILESLIHTKSTTFSQKGIPHMRYSVPHMGFSQGFPYCKMETVQFFMSKFVPCNIIEK